MFNIGNKPTKMDIMRKHVTSLYSELDDGQKESLEILLGTCDTDHMARLLCNLRVVKNKNFVLKGIDMFWDPNKILEAYRSGEIYEDYLAQCFFFNVSNFSIQTVNYDGNNRLIQTIQDNEDIVQYLDTYSNAIMSYDKDKLLGLDLDVLIVESIEDSTLERITRYIENNM